MQNMSTVASKTTPRRFIYLASPWAAKGGGMYKVADYLIQAQGSSASCETAELRALDTRGSGNAVESLWVLVQALMQIFKGRWSGQLAGVHVNMAERLSVFRKGVMISLCRALSIPVILHLHAAQLHHFYRKLPGPAKAMTRWVFSLPDSVIVLGTASRQFVIHELNVPAERVEIVINGVPEPTRLPPDRVQDSTRQILFLGNLSERKGVSDLLHALAMPGFNHSNLRLTLAGGGDVAAYKLLAGKLGLGHITEFTGWASQQQVELLLGRADVLVLPSYDEGLPLAILEAFAHGVAVVCSPVGEIPSVMSDGVDACFVDPGDVTTLSHTLQQVLNDSAFRERIARNGRAIYEQKFSMAQFFADIAVLHKRYFGISAQSGEPPKPKPDFGNFRSVAIREQSPSR